MALTKVNTDLLADGGKLNGIEAGADVTDTTNVTAAGALMDSELTSIASVKALNQGVATTDSPTFAAVTANGGVVVDNFTLDGTTLALSSGDMTLDAAGRIDLSADDSGEIRFFDGSSMYGQIKDDDDRLKIQGLISNKAMLLVGNDGGSEVTMLSLDAENAGAATFNSTIAATGIDVTGIAKVGSGSFDGGGVQHNYGSDANSRSWWAKTDTHGYGDFALRQSTTKTGSTYETKLLIDSSGNVGIGTTSPSKGLHLNFSNDLAAIRFQNTANAKVWDLTPSIPDVANSGFSLHNVTDNTVPLHVDNSGNVGIGTSSPSSFNYLSTSPHLVVGGGSSDAGVTYYSSTNGYGRLAFADGTNTTEQYRGLIQFYHGDNSMQFYTGSDERMRIRSNGEVEISGIGNTTGARLNIGSDSNNAFVRSYDTSQGMLIGVANAQPFKVMTNSSERMRIDSSGRLGLGVTPEAWSSVFKVLRVGTGSSIAGESGGTSTWFNTNAYYDGSWKRINTNTSAQIGHTSDGKQEFKVAASGSAGSAISWNTAVTINNSGALLVGGSVEGPGAQSGIALSGQETDSNIYIRHASGTGSGSRYMAFTYNTSQLGSITQHGTSQILFNTTSDERAKEKIVDAPSASDDIDAIQVRSFDWKADGEHQKYGMIAQELQTVAPEAVSGDADSEEMMGVDYSKLVPMLIKEIQSLRNRVAQLEE